MQTIAFRNAKITSYNQKERIMSLKDQRGHNDRLCVLEPYVGNEEHAKRRFVVVRSICNSGPNPALITNALQNGKRIWAEIIAKATEHLRVQSTDLKS